MAANTDPRLQNQVIYSIYVRNHTPAGTFRAVIPDLDPIDRRTGHDLSDPPRGGLSVYRSTRASSGFIVSAARRIASSAGRASTFGSMTSTEQGPS